MPLQLTQCTLVSWPCCFALGCRLLTFSLAVHFLPPAQVWEAQLPFCPPDSALLPGWPMFGPHPALLGSMVCGGATAHHGNHRAFLGVSVGYGHAWPWQQALCLFCLADRDYDWSPSGPRLCGCCYLVCVQKGSRIS